MKFNSPTMIINIFKIHTNETICIVLHGTTTAVLDLLKLSNCYIQFSITIYIYTIYIGNYYLYQKLQCISVMNETSSVDTMAT